jgi:2-keto-4-pentenoate hydratase/2-oxohepta-3-ene-1,7-dioic acid hydratase in catechol pathway
MALPHGLFLWRGDEVVCEIEGLSGLRNAVE